MRDLPKLSLEAIVGAIANVIGDVLSAHWIKLGMAVNDSIVSGRVPESTADAFRASGDVLALLQARTMYACTLLKQIMKFQVLKQEPCAASLHKQGVPDKMLDNVSLIYMVDVFAQSYTEWAQLWLDLARRWPSENEHVKAFLVDLATKHFSNLDKERDNLVVKLTRDGTSAQPSDVVKPELTDAEPGTQSASETDPAAIVDPSASFPSLMNYLPDEAQLGSSLESMLDASVDAQALNIQPAAHVLKAIELHVTAQIHDLAYFHVCGWGDLCVNDIFNKNPIVNVHHARHQVQLLFTGAAVAKR